MSKYTCKLCKKDIMLSGLQHHVKSYHNLNVTNYKLQVGEIKPRLCKCCDKNIQHLHHNRKFCNNACMAAHITGENIKKSHSKYQHTDEYAECKICKFRAPDLTSHIEHTHTMSCLAYKKTHNVSKVSSNKFRRDISSRTAGEKNPGYQHNGKFSAMSENFVKYKELSKKEITERKAIVSKKIAKSNKFNGNNHRTLAYWLNKANNNKALALQMLGNHQRRDLKWFINHFGEDEGKKRHALKTERWVKSFKKCNYSQISQKLFNAMIEHIHDTSMIYYATFDRSDMQQYINKEYVLKVEGSYVRPDFVNLATRKIIEFDGDYWHSPAVANPAREAVRDQKITNEGYQIMHIKECDYNADPTNTTAKCLAFATS